MRGVVSLVLIAVVLLLLASIGRRYVGAAGAGAPGDKAIRVAFFVNGTLGDKSFFDATARGVNKARTKLGLRTRIVEGGSDPTRWEPVITDLADSGDFDIIIAGTFTMAPLVESLAQQYPGIKFVLVDASVDYRQCSCGNVYSMRFRQNEGGYLAGFLAAELSASAQRSTGERGKVGVVGAMTIPVIDDYLDGFAAGATAARPNVTVLRQYVNSFNDPATGKEIGKALFEQGASVVFQAAGTSGRGVIEAGAEAHRYVIGVDNDQYLLYRNTSPQQAAYILTSVLKNVDVAILNALSLSAEHKLQYGRSESFGVADGSISLARSSPAFQNLPPPMLAALDAAEQDIVSGRVHVPSAFAAISTTGGMAR